MERIDEVLKKLQERANLKGQESTTSTLTSPSTNEYKCPHCKDKGFIFIDRDTVRPCGCFAARKRERLFAISQITDEFQALNFKNFQWKERPELIQQMFKLAVHYRNSFLTIKQNRENSIMFLGQPGAGKTHLLCAIANEAIEGFLLNVLYFPFVEGFNNLRSDFDDLESKLNEMKQCDLLFIDDLFKGPEKPTPFEIRQVYAVINARYLKHRPVMISSERSLDELYQIDEAIASRLEEMAKGHTIEVFGDSKELNWRRR